MPNINCRWLSLSLAAVSLTVAGGCNGPVKVRQPFPVPLIEPLPLRIAIHYPPKLAKFVFKEDAAAERNWTIQLGAANVRMFNAVFNGLFAVTQRVSSIQNAAAEMPGLDAIVSPVVDAFEFSTPDQSATDQFAVWIRYNLDVYDRGGQLLVRWPVAAYGQSGTRGMSDEQSMERATVLALRDAAATIALNFAKQPKIRQQLLKESSQNAP